MKANDLRVFVALGSGLANLAKVACLVHVVCVGVCLPATTHAHGADANTGDIRLAGDTAYVVVWPVSKVFSQFDDNRDGLIQKAETQAHRDAMLEHFRKHFVLEDQAGRGGETIFADLSTPLALSGAFGAGAEHLRVTLHIRWQEPPAWLVLRYTLLGEKPLSVRSARVTATKAIHEQRLLGPPELTVFDRAHPRHALLKASASTAKP